MADPVPPAPEADGTREPPDPDEQRRRAFRAALERKRAGESGTAQGGGKNGSKIHSSHGPVRQRRTFRRRSGG
jgi:hypothetical protein